MSYTIKKSDGTTLAVVPENDIVLNAASVALIGRGSTNYGIKHSEAFVHLIENFAHTAPPAYPLEGQLWFDKTVGSLKVYKGGSWTYVGGGGGQGGTGGVGGPIYVAVGSTSVLAFLAGGKVVAVIAASNIPNGDLPVNITVLEQTIPFRARFPFGLEAGFNLANDPDDYIVNGHVPNADASIYAGGGNPLAATTFLDLGPTSVAITVSNNAIVAVYSQSVVPQNNLPTNFTVGGVTMAFRSVFPSGLRAGLTLSTGMQLGIGSAVFTGTGSGGGVTVEVVAEMITEESEARATAISELYAYADENYAEAGLVNTLTATFLSATGQSSLASAIDWLVATAGSGTSNAQYAVDLKAEITNAITGATSFANALSILNTLVTTDYATASDLTSLHSTITSERTTAISNAVQNLVTTSNLTTALANFKTQLNSEFEADTGYSSFADAVNDLVTSGGSGGSTAAFDTDLRTRFTNAMQNGETAGAITTISQAMDKFKLFSGKIADNKATVDDIIANIKTLTGTGINESSATAINKLVSQSYLTGALATFKTSLTTEYVEAMNEVTGGTGVTFAAAITDVIATSTSDGSGSTSSIDTTLRNLFINQTNESEYPVTTVTQAIQKLMSNTTKDRALTSQVTQLEAAFTTGLGGSMANAGSNLQAVATKANSAAAFVTQLQSTLVSETGAANWSAAIDELATGADLSQTNATAITNIQSTFQTAVPGSTSFANAVQTMWTKANSLGSSASWGFTITAGNKIAGIESLANSATNTSVINIKADNFKFWHPDTPDIVPFEIFNNTVRIRNLVIGDSNIDANNLKQLTFTNEVYRGSTTITTTNSALYGGALAVSTGPVPAGSKVMIFLSSNVTGADSGGMYANVVRNDGIYCQGTAEFGNPDEGGSAQSWVWHDTVPSAGSWTYTVYGRRFGSSSTIRSAHVVGLVQKQYGSTTGSGAGGSTEPPVGGGGYYDPGSGGYTDGGGGCVEVNSYMHDGRFAYEVEAGDELRVLNYENMESTRLITADYSRIMPQPCVRLESESGIWIVCSNSTPLTLKTGEVVFNYEVEGLELAVEDKNGFRWEKIVKVTDAGLRDVVLISADNQTYASGGEPDRFIYTHNTEFNQKF